MENNELKKAGGDIIKINWPDSVLINSEYLIGSLTPDPSGKTCEGANNALKEIVENSIDVIYENPDATTLLVDTENFNGYNAVFDNSWGIPIRMSEVPGVTMARLSISELNAGSKFNGTGQSQGALIGRFGVGSSCTCALSKDYILLSKITNDNYNSSIPAVRELWEKSKTKKNLYYVVRYIDHGQLDFDGAMTLKQISKLIGVDIPEGFSTLVFFKLGEKYVPDPRVSIPYEDLEYFLLIAKEFYNRKVSVIANGKKLTAADLSSKYQFRIRKDIIPEDTSKNKVVNLIVYFDVDSELNKKSYFGCMNGLACTGTHINFVENAFEGAIRSYYGITHKYTTNWLKLCVIALAENVGFDTQYKQKVKSIGKVKQSDFSDALIKEFIKIFKKNPEIWDEYANKLNELAASMKALSASEKIQKMIENSQGRSIFKSKADLIPGFSDATGKDRWNCELFLCFTGDTEILTCNNECIKFTDLVDRLDKGEEIYTFSMTKDGVIKPAKIIAAKKIKKANKITTVTLDNGEVFRCTPDHKVMKLNGEYEEASKLNPGDSLMPIYIREVVEHSSDLKFANNPDFPRRVVRSKRNSDYGRPHKSVDRESNEYYVYRIMSTHKDVKLHESLKYLKDGEDKVRHHIDHNSLNDYPTNLMWCGSRWHLSHHGVMALHERAKQDPEFYKKMYIDSKNTPEYLVKRKELMKDFYSTETGDKMREHLRDKAIEEWNNEELRDWRSKETSKYAAEHPEWVKENKIKADLILSENTFNKVNKYIEDNNLEKTSFEFNKTVFTWKRNGVVNSNFKYFDFIYKNNSNLVKDYEISEFDEPLEVACILIFNKLKDRGENITLKSFNEESKILFNIKKLENGKGYLSLKKQYPKLFERYECDQNTNHKVLSIVTEDCEEDVYCLEVDTPEHNFPLAAGVFVKNCEGLSPAGSLKSGRPDTSKYAVCPLRGKIRSVLDDTVEEALENREIKTIFSVIGLGMADNNVTVGAKSDEEAYERIKKYSRYGKIIIAVDSDPDGADIEKLLLYLFGKFGQFLIKFGLLYRVVAPIIQQTINGVTYNYYPDDPIDPNTGLPVGVDPRYEIAYRKGLGSYQSKDLYDIFYGPKRRLIKITPEGLDYSMKLTEDINERKKLMIEAGVFTNPYNLPNVFNI